MEDIERISPVLQGERGNKLATKLLHWTGIDQLSECYGRHEELSGPDFVDAFLKDLGISYAVEGMENLKCLETGPFVTISNHPYGGLDGLVLIDLFGHIRDDYKVMVNNFLTMAKTIKENFISVVPLTNDSKGVAQESLRGVRDALRHIGDGHSLGLFPAGAVSDYSIRQRQVLDREWQPSALKLIRKMKVPVVPVHFVDKNSTWFYALGFISWRIRTIRLPKEILNKAGKTIRVRIGEAINVEKQLECPEEQYGAMLRESVYNT